MLTRTRTATLIGYLSVLIWSCDALVTTYLKTIPALQTVSLLFAISTLILLTVVVFRSSLSMLIMHALDYRRDIMVATLCLFGTHFFYIQAFKYAKPIFADLINYLWPVYLFLLMTAFTARRATRNEWIGLVLATCGVILLFCPADLREFFHLLEDIRGYVYAFLAGLSWALYNLYFSDESRHLGYHELTITFAALTVLAFSTHMMFDPTMQPTHTQFALISLLSICSVTLGYFLWNHGIQHGDPQVLSILSYQTPILSVVWLVFMGQASFSRNNIAATILITIGTYFCMKETSD